MLWGSPADLSQIEETGQIWIELTVFQGRLPLRGSLVCCCPSCEAPASQGCRLIVFDHA